MTARNKIAAAVAALGLITCATLTSAGTAGAAPAGPGAVLTKATVFFHTNNEDKDDDTHVTLWVRDKNNTTAAFISNDFAHFDDNSDNGPYSLQITNQSSWDLLNQGTSTIRIDPNGHDTWRFDIHVDLMFSDGSHLSTDGFGASLSQDRRQQTWGIA
ncbi:hypothetical protein [Kutzneria sp. CA-103260]|uniref:hypothetical protein n=1 Tax=Kutzneria sp. CA-103260 TaxID=2802641 RepID=UPI001BA97195|nr:hypothetical protein [Kutzneria sp. CA-103260]QUQ70763.1 hypothetical protein JJ691_85460 [Kutzneria sp. CA-103260]